jgi:hypothetical protein
MATIAALRQLRSSALSSSSWRIAGRKSVPDISGVRITISDDIAQKLVACSPTPQSRRAVAVKIIARTSGELFLYVNDAVLMRPGATDLFYGNYTGTGKVTVEWITEVPIAAR